MGFDLHNANYGQSVRGPLSEDDFRPLADTTASILHTIYMVTENAPLTFELWPGPGA